MEGWVDLGGWLHTEMYFLPADPSGPVTAWMGDGSIQLVTGPDVEQSTVLIENNVLTTSPHYRASQITYYNICVDEDYPAGPGITEPLPERSKWRGSESSTLENDCLRLALCTHSGACQKWMNEWITTSDWDMDCNDHVWCFDSVFFCVAYCRLSAC